MSESTDHPFKKGDRVRRSGDPRWPDTSYKVGADPFTVQAKDRYGVVDQNGQWHHWKSLEPVAPTGWTTGPVDVTLPMGNTFRDWATLDRGTVIQGVTFDGQGNFTATTLSGDIVQGTVGDPVDDGVTHPSHYNRGGIEVVDIIDAYGLDFYTGSGIKYVLRSQYKENELKDLKKAVDVLNKKIALLEATK